MAFFDGFQKVHLIGAGGIGVSAVGKLLAHKGKSVTGSDAAVSEISEGLVAFGIPVAVPQVAANVPADTNLVIYSFAAPAENPERARAAELGIRQMSYPEFLGELTKEYRTICVSGTNGKSTTTAMLGLILERAGLDPTVIVGSKLSSFPDGNLRLGKSDLLVLEACEHNAHILLHHPQMIVLTNIEEDHLDFYRDIAHIRETFQSYVEHLPADGTLILNADDPESRALRPKCTAVTYGADESADARVMGTVVEGGMQTFMMRCSDDPTPHRFAIGVPGKCNVMNATAAITAAGALGVSVAVCADALKDFYGVWRRFERMGERDGALVISDYGHHPTAIAGTIEATRSFYPGRRIVLAFQPHHRNRTRRLFDEFVESFDGADVLILNEIFDVAGRDEGADSHVSSAQLVAAVEKRDQAAGITRDVVFSPDLAHTLREIEAHKKPGDVILVMGAGDIYTLARKLV